MPRAESTIGKRPLPWKTIHSKVVYKTPWCTVREDIVRLPDGVVIRDYSVVQLRDAVMVFALTKDLRVPFVRQYRYGVGRVLLELPAGIYEKRREDPEKAAKREFWEETGYKAKKLKQIGVIYEYPTKDTHSITIYLTKNPVHKKREYREKGEDIQVVTIPFERIEDYIKNGKIAVAGSIAAVHLAKQYLDRK